MKRLSMLVIGIVLLVSPLHGCASSIEEVARRISFVGEECFIVCDDGTVFMNNIAKEEYPEVEEWKEIISISSRESLLKHPVVRDVIPTNNNNKNIFLACFMSFLLFWWDGIISRFAKRIAPKYSFGSKICSF